MGPSRFALEFATEAAPSGVELGERCRQAAHDLAEHGTPVRFLRVVYLPDEGVSVLLFEALDAAAALAAATRALGPSVSVVPVGTRSI